MSDMPLFSRRHKAPDLVPLEAVDDILGRMQSQLKDVEARRLLLVSKLDHFAKDRNDAHK